MAQLIFEIFSEEIPARMQLQAAENLRREFETKLQNLNLFYQTCKTYVTPRRLVLYVEGLSLTQEDSVIEKRGPRTDAADQALEGFLRASGLKKNQLTIKSTPKGDFYFAIITQKGKHTKDIIKEILEDILNNFYWLKSMRWGESKIKWVRPIQNIACLFGNEILPIEFGHLKANDISYGHRFLSNGSFKITDFSTYEKELRNRFVILDQTKRKSIILDGTLKEASSKGLQLINDEKLLDEVTGLVEYPVILVGNIDQNFMSLPEEVLITTIRINQKYFCVRDRSGKLAPYFIVVSNMKTSDNGAKIIAGNERVVKARLKDAEFFYNQDKATGINDFGSKLKKVIFHNEVGTIAERVERIEDVAHFITQELGIKESTEIKRAAKILKNDLGSEMVGEFPELQGIIGYYYALENNEPIEVARAIKNQYRPQGPNDFVPDTPVSYIIALAEKIEGLTALFAAGERATGSKDPYALRRLSLGILRIIGTNNLFLDLKEIFKKTFKLLPSSTLRKIDKDETLNELFAFITERIKYQFKSENLRQEITNAVIENADYIDYCDYKSKIGSLTKYIESNNGAAAVEAYKRAANILKMEEKKDGVNYKTNFSNNLLQNQIEVNLSETLEEVEDRIKPLIKEGNFDSCLLALTKLTQKINNFYDNTQINTDDRKIRENRLKLTAAIVEIFEKIARFDLI